MKILGERLKELRIEKKLSQTCLADLLKISQTCISGWETGYRQPNVDDLVVLAKFFEVSTDYLLGLED